MLSDQSPIASLQVSQCEFRRRSRSSRHCAHPACLLFGVSLAGMRVTAAASRLLLSAALSCRLPHHPQMMCDDNDSSGGMIDGPRLPNQLSSLLLQSAIQTQLSYHVEFKNEVRTRWLEAFLGHEHLKVERSGRLNFKGLTDGLRVDWQDYLRTMLRGKPESYSCRYKIGTPDQEDDASAAAKDAAAAGAGSSGGDEAPWAAVRLSLLTLAAFSALSALCAFSLSRPTTFSRVGMDCASGIGLARRQPIPAKGDQGAVQRVQRARRATPCRPGPDVDLKSAQRGVEYRPALRGVGELVSARRVLGRPA